ncbi:tetratricopeptide repeat protein [Crateriforma conspicua]|uniref:Tetratricopeptide repeat protein n=1 Tax=Crateriforma conspicua TaxID=2527996 RepID=A0A5C5YFU3_9PLAN|nr:hypothetical protein [Crateriforma conspicua]QDV61619.1 hypothetical protein Mal65_07450 [Crateriforma conspicua]TWT72132.1 hypothetical protein Pan14r_44490 [Crateriforma conspicua]
MTRHFQWFYAAAALLACCLTTAPAQGQLSVLNTIYGQGVHAYNSHQYDQAYQLFSQAITHGYQDPRAYYFRGFAADAMGRQYEAEADWQAGAELEARGKVNGDIGRSLSRIQGSARLKLEEIRREARVQQLMLGQARSNQRMNEIQAASPAPATPPPAPPVADAPATPPSDQVDPFADDPVADATVESKDVLEGTLDEDPFKTDGNAAAAQPADAPADDNPFGGSDDSNPFGDAGGDDNPFGDMGGDDNPFGDSPF